MRHNKEARAIRWAFRGALLLGTMGFLTGLGLCLIWSWPIPPLFVTEIGIFAGAIVGSALSQRHPSEISEQNSPYKGRETKWRNL